MGFADDEVASSWPLLLSPSLQTGLAGGISGPAAGKLVAESLHALLCVRLRGHVEKRLGLQLDRLAEIGNREVTLTLILVEAVRRCLYGASLHHKRKAAAGHATAVTQSVANLPRFVCVICAYATLGGVLSAPSGRSRSFGGGQQL